MLISIYSTNQQATGKKVALTRPQSCWKLDRALECLTGTNSIHDEVTVNKPVYSESYAVISCMQPTNWLILLQFEICIL